MTTTTKVTVGSTFSGYGGLDLALSMAGVDHKLAFVADPAPAASAVLAERFPDVENLGDITTLDSLPQVDIITGGLPCQPYSQAGKRKGMSDERYLFEPFLDLVEQMDPLPILFLENVPGLLTADKGEAFGTVLKRLADMGMDARWLVLRASEVGAAHQRKRVFLVAAHASRVGRGSGTGSRTNGSTAVRWPGPSDSSGTSATDAGCFGLERVEEGDRPNRDVEVESRDDAARCAVDFGKYSDAVDRWAAIHGPHPHPLTPGDRLNPEFSEWLMGVPTGWVTDLDLSRKRMLECIGNGVVPHQAAAAWRMLTEGDDDSTQSELFPVKTLPTALHRDHKDSMGTTAPANGYLGRVIRDITGGPRRP